jgi:site-specific DNA recombinase
MAVPAIVDEVTFARVQATLRARSPKVMAPRNVTGPTMLASVARCAACGSAMILNTGKGGTYRYYSCSKVMKQGKTACSGRRIRMDHLDDMVLAHLSERLFTPERLTDLLQGYIAEASASREARREKLRQARDARNGADAAIARLLALVETGAMEPDAPELRERLVALRLQKTELGRDITRLQANLQTGQTDLSPETLKTLSIEMRRRLAEGPQELRQAYMKLLLDSVTVDHLSIRLEGSPAILEKLANRGPSKSSPEVLSFVQEWRPREDSNLRPPV